MSLKERLLHMVLYEVIALAIFVPVAAWVLGKEMDLMTALMLMLAVIAMLWNFVYNWIIDRIFGDNRIERRLGFRILHGIGFEVCMVIGTLPVIMWMLQMNAITVLLMDMGATTFFFLYTIAFNWAYDHLREYWRKPADVTV